MCVRVCVRVCTSACVCVCASVHICVCMSVSLSLSPWVADSRSCLSQKLLYTICLAVNNRLLHLSPQHTHMMCLDETGENSTMNKPVHSKPSRQHTHIVCQVQRLILGQHFVLAPNMMKVV